MHCSDNLHQPNADKTHLHDRLCTVFVGAFDSLWMAFLTIAICGTSSLAVFTVAANRLADPTAKHEGKDEDLKDIKTNFDDEEDFKPAKPTVKASSKFKRGSKLTQQNGPNVLQTAEMSPAIPSAGNYSFRGRQNKNRSSSNSSNKVEPMNVHPLQIDPPTANVVYVDSSVLVPPGSRTITAQERAAIITAQLNGEPNDPAMESHSAFLAAMAARAYSPSGLEDPNAMNPNATIINHGDLIMLPIDENGAFVISNPTGMCILCPFSCM